MESIKNKQQLIELTNELIGCIGETKEIAEMIDDVIFNYISFACSRNECVSIYDEKRIFALKEVRDLFWKLDTN